jgi:glucosyl-dolichyl phosphate glucuronosyltransferase
MTLDVILPTFNREALLARALDSLRRARVPATMYVRVLVVDNGSTDGTRALVGERSRRPGIRFDYLFVSTPGKPYALNAGIAESDADLIGLIDDDEEIDPGWFVCIQRTFDAADGPTVDFIGGKCLPSWDAARPAWLGGGYLGVIGWVDPGPDARAMDGGYPGILMGGNAVIRRRVLDRAGPYSTALNRTGARLLGCEDEDMYHRLLALGARGRYVPNLVIYHHVPEFRLQKRYFRRWCFWRGVSLGMMDVERPAPVAYLAGVPRYAVGRAGRAVWRATLEVLRLKRQTDPATRFEYELACWDLAGFFWGKLTGTLKRDSQTGQSMLSVPDGRN